MRSNDNTMTVNTDATEVKQYLITEEKYQLLREFQQDVFKEIELLPSIRKLMNDLINQENLEQLKTKYLNLLK